MSVHGLLFISRFMCVVFTCVLALKVTHYLRSKGFKVAICQEFRLGIPLPDNIDKAVSESRKAIVLMSEAYIQR